MADDEFVAKINGQKVLDGKNWEEIRKATFDITGSKFNITRCGKNTLTIEGMNNGGEASIAYTLEEETDCRDCAAGQEFNNALCQCSQIPGSIIDWNYLEKPMNFYSHPLDF